MPLFVIYSLLYVVLLPILLVVGLFNKKIKKGIQLRRKKNGTYPWLNTAEGQEPIWFHCSSGEFEYAKPVIRQIKKENPQQKIMVTYFSPSVEKSLAQNTDVDFYCPTPWDTAFHFNKFIVFHKPKALLIARTDLWPAMIFQSKKHKIPSLLFSKTVNKSKMGPGSFFSHALVKKMDDVFCATEEDRKLLCEKLRPFHSIHAAGDTRYDQCLHRIQNSQTLKPLNNFNKPIFIAGSTWPSDERVLLDLIIEKINDVSFIVAPHEPSKEHLKILEILFDRFDIKLQKYSETKSWDPSAVLIIDQVGILADLYSWGQFAFIGGSTDRSVHSVMEPLAYGLLCFVGPFHENNREALVFNQIKIKDMTPVQVVRDCDELVRRFSGLYRSWSNSHRMELKMAVRQKAGASAIVVKWLKNNSSFTS